MIAITSQVLILISSQDFNVQPRIYKAIDGYPTQKITYDVYIHIDKTFRFVLKSLYETINFSAGLVFFTFLK